ncbi:MAG: YncE family protein [Caldilinea sp.]
MRMRSFVSIVAGFCLAFILAASTVPGMAQDTLPVTAASTEARLGAGFSYQGRLTQNGAPVTALCDFEFKLWDAATAGAQQGTTKNVNAVQVSQGLFTIPSLDFGSRQFIGDNRWLEIGVRCPAGSGSFTTLSPRQALLATPYALGLQPGADIVGNVLDAGADTAVLTVINTNEDPAPDGAYGLHGLSYSPTGAGVMGRGTAGAGGYFYSEAGFALVAPGPSLIGARTSQQIGMLRWYDANRTAPSVAVGSAPDHFAFDGVHLWVTNFFSSNLYKIRAADMAVIGIYDTVNNPNPIAFDGANVWVASETAGVVAKVRASDGVEQQRITTLPSGHWGMAFDGEFIWVSNTDSASVSKIRASTGDVIGAYPVGAQPRGIAFDGANIWVANDGDDTVTKLNGSTGAVIDTYPVGDSPIGVAFDGANIWVANSADGTVSKLRAYDGLLLATCSAGTSPFFIAFDGFHIWVTNYTDPGTVTRVQASNCGMRTTLATGRYPFGVAFDGANIWTADSYSNAVTKH